MKKYILTLALLMSLPAVVLAGDNTPVAPTPSQTTLTPEPQGDLIKHDGQKRRPHLGGVVKGPAKHKVKKKPVETHPRPRLGDAPQ